MILLKKWLFMDINSVRADETNVWKRINVHLITNIFLTIKLYFVIKSNLLEFDPKNNKNMKWLKDSSLGMDMNNVFSKKLGIIFQIHFPMELEKNISYSFIK